jgi:exopolysaccharide biosynthesis polyprenyl glycosylphosphotransferase
MQKKIEDRNHMMERLISAGQGGTRFSLKFKILLWGFTVQSSYFIKRLMDIAISGTLLIIFFPFFALLALAIRMESKGPVIFTQARVGLDGRHFRFYKFRSMVVDAEKIKEKLAASNESKDGVIFKMKKDPRITKIGAFIRKFSIDELPQLFNVFKGDMSLVGPRPPIPKEVAEYNLEDRKRLHVKPGITCIWQISGRSDIPFKQQAELDKQYIKSKSVWQDIKILVLTIPAVIGGKGAY